MCPALANVKYEFFFLPTSRTVLLLFKHFAQLWSILPRWHFFLPTFKFRPGKWVFWGEVGGVLCTYISRKGFVTAE